MPRKHWPKITIVTPSYNQAQFLEETIRSVLLQGYPNLEYIIMDGGSTDQSVEIIKNYEPWLTFWVSEKDNGQADAIYRGFERAAGELIGWLNSDDLLLPGALFAFADYYLENPGTELMVGGCVLIDEGNRVLRGKRGFPRFSFGPAMKHNSLLWAAFDYHQPATLWRRDVFFEVGGFDRGLFFCFDYDLYLKLTKRRSGESIKRMVAAFRIHAESKTSLHIAVGLKEHEMVRQKNVRTSRDIKLQNVFSFIYRNIAVIKWRISMLLYFVGIKKCRELELFD